MSRIFETTVFHIVDVLRNILLNVIMENNAERMEGGTRREFTNYMVFGMKFNKRANDDSKTILHHTSNPFYVSNKSISPWRLQDLLACIAD